MDSKGNGRRFFQVCFCFVFPLVLGLCLWWFAVVQAAGLDALAVFWSGSCCGAGNVVTIVFTWLVTIVFMDSKGNGRHFFRVCFWLCFPLVLGLCIIIYHFPWAIRSLFTKLIYDVFEISSYMLNHERHQRNHLPISPISRISPGNLSDWTSCCMSPRSLFDLRIKELWDSC